MKLIEYFVYTFIEKEAEIDELYPKVNILNNSIVYLEIFLHKRKIQLKRWRMDKFLFSEKYLTHSSSMVNKMIIVS